MINLLNTTPTIRLLKYLALLLATVCSPLFSATTLPPHAPVPGGIVVLEIPDTLTANRSHLTAHYQGSRVILLSPAETGKKRWLTIVGIPLSAEPGSHQLTINSDQNKPQHMTFAVEPKIYEEQRITLTNKRQVNPLQTDLKRIAREQQIMVAAFNSWNTSFKPTMTLAKPAAGPLSSPFGLRRFFNDQPRNPHSGLDIAAPEGTPIRAPAEGIVVATGDYFFNGKTLLLEHGHGLVTMYCHMSRIDVTEGDHVQLNDMLGLVGKTGRVTGAHLHWSVSLNNARIDPNLLMLPETEQRPSTP